MLTFQNPFALPPPLKFWVTRFQSVTNNMLKHGWLNQIVHYHIWLSLAQTEHLHSSHCLKPVQTWSGCKTRNPTLAQTWANSHCQHLGSLILSYTESRPFCCRNRALSWTRMTCPASSHCEKTTTSTTCSSLARLSKLLCGAHPRPPSCQGWPLPLHLSLAHTWCAHVSRCLSLAGHVSCCLSLAGHASGCLSLAEEAWCRQWPQRSWLVELGYL